MKNNLPNGLCAALVVLVTCFAAAADAQEEKIPTLDELFNDNAVEVEQIGTPWALIICGHPGDADHRETYAESVEQIVNGLITNLGFSADNIRIQFGSEKAPEDGPALSQSRGMATRAEIAAEVADLRQQIQPDDTLWVIVMGHAHWDGRNCFLNIPQEDMDENEFAALFDGLVARQQVFLMTTSVSGFLGKPLSAKGRIVITATEADLETNETLFHAALGEVLSKPPYREDFDADTDGAISLFDVYIAVLRNVANRYVGDMLLSTEHALLDDNGDGRGTELQLDYLTEEQGGRATADSQPPKIRPNSEGALAIEMRLPFANLEDKPPEEPMPEETPAEPEPEAVSEEIPAPDLPARDPEAEEAPAEENPAPLPEGEVGRQPG